MGGDGLGFDWAIGSDGVMDIEVSGEPLGQITVLVEAANHLVDLHRPQVVRLFCWAAPASAAQASVMSAALGLLAPSVPVAMMIDASKHLAVFKRQAGRSAPWLAFGTDSEVAAAAAAWLLRG
jgi:hypothetical protein